MAETERQIVERVAREVGVDPTLAWAVAMQESGGNPKAHNPNGEDSWGLFQGNRNGGMGTGYSPQQLMDPEFNARLMLSAMAATQKKTGLTGGALAAASQRPADPQGYARSVNQMLSGGKGLPHTGSPFSPGGAPVTAYNQTHENRGPMPAPPTPPPADTTTLGKLRKRETDLEAQITDLREKAKSGGEYERGKALEALPDLERQLTTVVTQIAAEENRMRDDQKGSILTGKDGKSYWIKDGKATEIQGMGAAEDDGQIVNLGQAGGVLLVKKDGTVKELVRPQGKETTLQTINDPQTGAVWTYNPTTGEKGTQLFEGKGADQVALADEKSTADLAALRRGIQLADEARAAVAAALDLPPGLERTQALQDAQQRYVALVDPSKALDVARTQLQETRTRAQALETQTGYRHNYETGEQLTENGQPVPTLARQEQLRAQEERESQNTASGIRGLLDWETRRSAEATRAVSEHFQTGIGSLRDRSDFQQLIRPLDEQTAAQAIGLDPSSPKFRTIWQSAQSFFGRQGMAGSQGQPNAPSAENVTQTPPVQQPQPAPAPAPQPAQRMALLDAVMPQQRALDAQGVNAPGWAVNEQGGQQIGEVYDIDDGVPAAGPPPTPTSLQLLIRSLGTQSGART